MLFENYKSDPNMDRKANDKYGLLMEDQVSDIQQCINTIDDALFAMRADDKAEVLSTFSADLESKAPVSSSQGTKAFKEELVVVNSLDSGKVVAQILEAQKQAYDYMNLRQDADLKTIVELKYEASSDEELKS